MSINEKISNYPPQSAYFIDADDNRYDVVDGPRSAIRVTTVGASGAVTDAFGRQRMSQPYTLFDTRNRYYDHGDFSAYVESGASVTYVPAESSFNLTVPNTTSKVVRETKRTFAYQPGKSLLILNTFCMANNHSTLTQRVGYFNSNNGIFLEREGSTAKIVKRTSSDGSVADIAITQENWNGDKLDGTGPSGLTLELDNTQIFWIDIEWLGVGSVRAGFVINGEFIVCHTFNHANIEQMVYMTTANLPVRYELERNGSSATSATMKQICSSVVSEGGYDAKAPMDFATTANATKTLATGGVTYPLVSIKLNSSRQEAIITPAQLEMMISTNDNVRYYIYKNATLTNASFSTHSKGTVDVDTSATAISGGEVIGQGFIYQKGAFNLGGKSEFNYQLERALASASTYTSDVLTIAATSPGNTVGVNTILGWYELS